MTHSRTRLGAAVLAALLASGCGGSSSGEGANISAADLADSFAYDETSEYASVLVPCVSATSTKQSCKLSELPLIGMTTDTPTVDDVMKRAVVSHSWMGDRLRAVLERMPPSMFRLFRSVTAVVVDGDIRPAYITNLTGAIYFDADYLWLTNDEKATISKKEDYRSSYGDALAFRSLSRYTKNNEYAYPYYDLAGDDERAIDDIIYLFARVMYHELAHAVDFYPPHLLGTFDPDDSVNSASAKVKDQWISTNLNSHQPLTSVVWKALARVLFSGTPATLDERTYEADYVGALFHNDGANDDYSYHTSREDIAMLLEETMMMYEFGLERDVAFTDLPKDQSCASSIVAWGYRGRIREPHVALRARMVLDYALPEVSASGFFDSLPPAEPMAVGADWCDNLDLAADNTAISAAQTHALKSKQSFSYRVYVDSTQSVR